MGSNCLFPIETHITCDFPGGGSGPPVPPSGSALGHVAFNLKGMKRHASKYFALTHSLDPRWGLTFFSSKVVMFHIEWTERLVMYIPLSSIPWVGWGGVVAGMVEVFFNPVGDSCIA